MIRLFNKKSREGVKNKKQRIVFVHQCETLNTGDISCCPLLFYYDYFKDFDIKKVAVGNDEAVKTIQSDDIVIIGGGGLINTLPEWNRNINFILERAACVIGWSLGFNSHYDDNDDKEPINFQKFKLLTIRDFNHPSGLRYLPCVSLKSSLLDTKKPVVRKLGIVNHMHFPVNGEGDAVANNIPMVDIVDFIAKSEEIVTSTYHSALWALYMGKTVYVVNKFSPKFDYMEYKPVFLQTFSEVASCKDKGAFVPEDALRKARSENDKFFLEVKDLIQEFIKNKKA